MADHPPRVTPEMLKALDDAQALVQRMRQDREARQQRLGIVLDKQLRRPRGVGPQHRQRGWGAPDFSGLLAALVLMGVLIGLGVAWGVPWLWALLKPLLHAATA